MHFEALLVGQQTTQEYNLQVTVIRFRYTSTTG